jgi:cell pole-organizing protein PopZ
MKAPQPESAPKATAHPITPPSTAGIKTSPDAPRRDLSPSVPQARPDAEPQRPKSSPEDRTLLSERSDAAVSGAFSVLAHTILAQNARTLEDLVAEMLRPMLKDWLDENLPSLVEKLVKEEIERVSRGRR